jgi:hypothetical protein
MRNIPASSIAAKLSGANWRAESQAAALRSSTGDIADTRRMISSRSMLIRVPPRADPGTQRQRDPG